MSGRLRALKRELFTLKKKKILEKAAIHEFIKFSTLDPKSLSSQLIDTGRLRN